MSTVSRIDKEYVSWLADIKYRIRSTQIKASIIVNSELIKFYWELGKMIVEKQSQTAWGDKLIEQLSLDLKLEFPDMKGFSVTNLSYCKQFFRTYPILPQLGGQLPNNIIFNIPWGHIKLIIGKVKDLDIANFYFEQTLKNGWSRDTLAIQIKNNLHKRAGKSITNFSNTLPQPFSDLVQQTIKDPYVFDFMTMAQPYKEKDIENQLVRHITKFILELGKGFAFVGQQYHLEIAESDYYLDLLFYHIRLKCYVVIELKNTKFIPEYAGKLNFYLSAVDTLLKQDDDKPTIGILLCRDKNNIEAEFALRDINKPMGVSEFSLIEALPDDLRSSLPTVEEIENELNNLA